MTGAKGHKDRVLNLGERQRHQHLRRHRLLRRHRHLRRWRIVDVYDRVTLLIESFAIAGTAPYHKQQHKDQRHCTLVPQLTKPVIRIGDVNV